MGNTPFDDLVTLHEKAKRMMAKPEAQIPHDVIKLQLDTLDALVRLASKFKAYL